MAKKVEILRRETIKPSSPTPQNLKLFKISLMDQFIPVTYIPLILFYSAKDGDVDDHHEKSLKLKKSLSETLTHFYPLAGRLKDNFFVECDDQGAEFIQARIEFSLSEVLKEPDPDSLKQFLPAALESPEAASGNLLLVQATFFSCGGLAIGLCVTHKLADAATLTTFIKCWSATAIGSSEVAVPAFLGSSIYPPLELPIPVESIGLQQRKCSTRRFVFEGSKMDALKAKAASIRVPKPTRVEAVSGLLWKCAIRASKSIFKSFKPSVWSISVNMRSRFTPALPENCAGNCLGSIDPRTEENESSDEIEMKFLVGKIREEKENFGENYVKRVEGEGGLIAVCENAKEYGEMVMSNEIEFYICSSWCRFDIYGAEFGWGKATWIGHASTSFRNAAILMDTRDGDGIEAWLTLSEEEMALFQSDEQLLEFAHVNPSITV